MKKIRTFPFFLIGAFVFSSCQKSNWDIGNLIDRSTPAGYVSYYPQRLDKGNLENKGMGWVALEEQTELGKMDLGASGLLPEAMNIGIQTSWDLIEKKEGEFDWSLIDKCFEYWTERGKRMNLRICTDSLSLPEVIYGAPRWLNKAPYNLDYEEYVYAGTRMAYTLDTTHPTYRLFFERFMDKLSERYADNPYLDTIDIRGYGMFGEWHSGHSFQTMSDREKGLAYIIDQYASRFAKKGKQLFLSCSWDFQGINKDGSSAAHYGNNSYDRFIKQSAFDHAMASPKVGFRRDGMAGNGITKYGTDEKLLNDSLRSGKKVANCAEYFTGPENYISGKYGMNPYEATTELIYKSRANFSTILGWTNGAAAESMGTAGHELFELGTEKMGYRFACDYAKFPEGAKAGATVEVLTRISNSAVGRFALEGHHFALLLANSQNKLVHKEINRDFDPRILLNGEFANVFTTLHLPSHLAEGRYSLLLALVDENGNPSIRLGQVGSYKEKLYPLGELKIGNYETPKASLYASYASLEDITLAKNKTYELTFDYEPTLSLKDFRLGDLDGFLVKSVSGGEETIQSQFQDVSEEKACKSVVIFTGDDEAKIKIEGTGIYEGKIETSNYRLIDKSGYNVNFTSEYNLLSTSSPFYCDNDQTVNEADNVILSSSAPHEKIEVLKSDPRVLPLKKNTSYTISFRAKGEAVGGNACFYSLSLFDKEGKSQNIGSWYDREDEPTSNKTFTFSTTDKEGLYLSFGINNVGAYSISRLTLLENSKGYLISGQELPSSVNKPHINEKKGLGYTEDFEDMCLNDSTFQAGFSRWGHLTSDKTEVIEGNVSFTSEIDQDLYQSYNDSNWFEFMYSNPKYLKFKAKGKYKISFDFLLLDEIRLNTSPDDYGFAYFLARDAKNKASDSQAVTFADRETALRTKISQEISFTLGDSDDYYLILGVYGRGKVIVDNVKVTEE